VGVSAPGKIVFIELGKPVQNAYIESFNGKLRNECLNLERFVTLRAAQQVIEQWRVRYNRFRRHAALGNTPPEISQQQQQVEKLYASMR
jgi:putative transposase